jgi:hypothetical protein
MDRLLVKPDLIAFKPSASIKRLSSTLLPRVVECMTERRRAAEAAPSLAFSASWVLLFVFKVRRQLYQHVSKFLPHFLKSSKDSDVILNLSGFDRSLRGSERAPKLHAGFDNSFALFESSLILTGHAVCPSSSTSTRTVHGASGALG